MKQFNKLPKTVKKTVRYILQDANLEKLDDIENILIKSIKERRSELAEKKEHK
ncbi:hypothetical protein [Aquibacillus rhizosphaerae]|uniref:LytR family transcriptional regulator n=1 Tax=Aquibacillus rhizosphaerae TaxID=3051431 RepID=A0ABT7KZF7_9BACI|nr:hypothetical protein [Aquibacillus sp. LR5S19]MDL4838902.1 hypothetical protein [Aquibacillus sp. LR5S19]